MAWSVELVDRDKYQLVNHGTHTAEGVTFEVSSAVLGDADVPPRDVQSGARVAFMALVYAERDGEPAVTVEWGPPSKRLTWYSHLPG